MDDTFRTRERRQAPVDLAARASKLQAQAHDVIRQLQLQERWGEVGEVTFSGSSQFGLMVTPNIDMEVYTDQPRPSAGFQVIAGIAEIPGVRRVRFKNQLDDLEDPGLFWWIQYRDQLGQDWSIDTWLVPSDHPFAMASARFAEAMRDKLDDPSRRTILQIKHEIRCRDLDTRSIEIYKAVLRDGVSTSEQFERWLAEHPPKKLEDWMP
jgi:hypothetical protein